MRFDEQALKRLMADINANPISDLQLSEGTVYGAMKHSKIRAQFGEKLLPIQPCAGMLTIASFGSAQSKIAIGLSCGGVALDKALKLCYNNT